MASAATRGPTAGPRQASRRSSGAGSAPASEPPGSGGGTPPVPTVAYLGPAGTFTEEALGTQPDLAAGNLLPMATIADVLEAVVAGQATRGFVPIENAIEGSVHATVDSLVFEHELLVQREVVLDVHLCLMAPPGTELADVRHVLSFPVATAQCRRFLAERLPGVEVVPTNSTAEAARLLGASPRADAAAVSPRLAADLYGLDILASAIEDHPDNQTRFVTVARSGIPAPTGHDKTSIVCFQRADRPGSLHAILSEFAARDLNLTKLESRPTKRQLGSYCFLVDLEGHLADEVVADCLRVLHAELADVKFLGSYPAAGAGASVRRARAGAAWRRAETWLDGLRLQIEPSH
ncbi:MAG: prephenate dehydratase [Actinomycetota bacterium]|nr:prephenate dehydratase [Actinomycetota bacterium]MDA8281505.1 prephenate dehydratase [Actinomycetota bacterium]